MAFGNRAEVEKGMCFGRDKVGGGLGTGERGKRGGVGGERRGGGGGSQ